MADCGWTTNDSLYQAYHDDEWGVPVTNDNQLFEMLVLESMQAGLSWLIVLKKRKEFRRAFCNFIPERVAQFNNNDMERLLSNPLLIRNRLKMQAAITNAKAFVRVQAEWGSFAKYLWSFVHYSPEIHQYVSWDQIPAYSSLSEILSRDLKRRGFQFVGPTVCYSYCQAVGVVMDHIVSCDRYSVLSQPKILHL
ncbi:DNA-3-methyladenine glycosylase I [Sulfobacillus thermosulfidooxidans DSM 9293]|uniref:DNA-3-methyladenine glycosylase I n=1 Tax=Sulfobacillus thermosulfidooxidans (strain DSM 9293 / VKM B-1269 / AT-1) TaxID=929705 RepID=A0A1W1WKU3_SULTA|nr:DNA-3-methyladenine glycosylase I [Sulfobacillus thermosulfidooxidans]SMC06931.1 DNA-3-methyladenine glycosylase I [Sulfobacillus thermosulfidooxidans DSM 9293]